MTSKRQLTNWLCLSGVVALVFYILHDYIGGLYYPGYNRLQQAVSDLTSMNAPSFMVANGLATVYGLFSCLGCIMVCIVVQGKANKSFRVGVYLFAVMNWVSGIGYSLFPLSDSGFGQSFQDIMHLVVTILVVGLSIASLLLMGIGGVKLPGRFKVLAVVSFAALLLMFVGSVGVNVVAPRYFGLVERFGNYSAVTFGAVLSVFGIHDFWQVQPSQ